MSNKDLREYLIWKRWVPWARPLRDAIGEHVGTEEQRLRFSVIVVHSFTYLAEWARQQHYKRENAERMAYATAAAREAFSKLLGTDLTESTDILALHAEIFSAPPDPAVGRVDLEATLRYLAELEKKAIAQLVTAPRPRTGPQDVLAVTVATRIAIVYQMALGRHPSLGRRGGVISRLSPFDRVCSVIEEMLQEENITTMSKGEPRFVGFSDHCKRRAIEEARTAATIHSGAFTEWMRGQIAIFEQHRSMPVERILSDEVRDLRRAEGLRSPPIVSIVSNDPALN